MILDRLAEELGELGVVEQRPMQEGRNMTMMLAPSKAVLSGRLEGSEGDHAAEDGTPGESTPVEGALAEAPTSDSAPADVAVENNVQASSEDEACPGSRGG